MTDKRRTQQILTVHTYDFGVTIIDTSTVSFKIWAPRAQSVAVDIVERANTPLQLTLQPFGYWQATAENVHAGTRYRYILNDEMIYPDPTSRSQPDGVHGPSEIINPQDFPWTDQQWKGLPLHDLIVYEIHPGTFTQAGTFDAIIPWLPYLLDEVGITAIELMPIAQFPGVRNWGYDGTYLFAPHNSYGGPWGLHRLVDACHAAGLAVILDVVYNHLGPEGNYWGALGPFFTDQYRTPWGNAVNYDGPHSDAVRNTIIDNAVYWIRDYHIDALRLDAIHSIFDFSARHILEELSTAVHDEAARTNRTVHVIAESDLNDAKIIAPTSKGGYGLDGQWNDDFHHALHSLVTGEKQGYYSDFGTLDHVATGFKKHFILSGQYSYHRQRRHGNSAAHLPATSFVVFAQNHDQIGNRAEGDRLSTLIPHSAQQVLMTSILLSPFIPMLFMGEEYSEHRPFQYFIDHGDEQLIEAVRKGRLAEFKKFGWKNVPDPYDVKTFEDSRLTPSDEQTDLQSHMTAWIKQLITLRKQHPSLGPGVKGHQLRVWTHKKHNVLTIYRKHPDAPAMLLLLGFNNTPSTLTLRQPKHRWTLLLDSGRQDYASPDSEPPSPAPKSLDLTEHKETISLPPFPAWVYSRSE
ncbi:MAG: malto-oligosyltrehalose trehalohydrolase [Nitrospirales bacterium]|nr:MAG: malto-oligosyltrehalose trehalohydrolase [Nitrospirales bacterium]